MARPPNDPKILRQERAEVIVVHQHCPDQPYLELEIPDGFHAADYVEFVVSSRDQGKPSSHVSKSRGSDQDRMDQ